VWSTENATQHPEEDFRSLDRDRARDLSNKRYIQTIRLGASLWMAIRKWNSMLERYVVENKQAYGAFISSETTTGKLN